MIFKFRNLAFISLSGLSMLSCGGSSSSLGDSSVTPSSLFDQLVQDVNKLNNTSQCPLNQGKYRDFSKLNASVVVQDCTISDLTIVVNYYDCLMNGYCTQKSGEAVEECVSKAKAIAASVSKSCSDELDKAPFPS